MPLRARGGCKVLAIEKKRKFWGTFFKFVETYPTAIKLEGEGEGEG